METEEQLNTTAGANDSSNSTKEESPRDALVSPPSPTPAPEPLLKVPVGMEGVLLPKKEPGPSVLSAQRVNAAAVLEATHAPLKPTNPKKPAEMFAPQGAVEYASDVVPTVHTFKTDTEDMVRTSNVSLTDIAAAEARKREERPLSAIETHPVASGGVPERRALDMRHILEVAAGLLFILGALGVIAFAFLREQRLPKTAPQNAPFIFVDSTEEIPLFPGESSSNLLQALQQEKLSLQLSVGLVSRFSLTETATTSGSSPTELTAQEFFADIAPDASPSLARSLEPTFLLGVHSFAGNEPFVLFKTASYAQAFAGMLQWEESMQQDLTPFFSSTATTSQSVSRTTASSGLTTQPLRSPFRDQVIGNHDARVILDASGNIVLLWTFLDRTTLLITTNANTLQEIVSRLTTAPIVPVPGQ